MKYYYFGIHKAASTWTLNVLNQVCNNLNLKHHHYHSPKMYSQNLNTCVEDAGIDFISLTNADYNDVSKIDHEFRGFHIVRDPRDIVVSSYFSHLKSHPTDMWPELIEYRNELKSLNVVDGITATMKHLENMYIDGSAVPIFKNLSHWNYNDSRIYEIKFEDLTKNSYVEMPQIMKFLGLLREVEIYPTSRNLKRIFKTFKQEAEYIFNLKGSKKITLSDLLYIIYLNDFYFKSSGRKKGSSNENSHYRKGTTGDWVNHFTKEQIKLFKDQYGDLLIKMGYEENYDW